MNTKKAPDYETVYGHDVIKIYTGHKYMKDGEETEEFVSFGVRKAQAICDNIDHVRRFAEKGRP